MNDPKNGLRALARLGEIIDELAPHEPDIARDLRFLRQEFHRQVRSRMQASRTLGVVTRQLHEALARGRGAA